MISQIGETSRSRSIASGMLFAAGAADLIRQELDDAVMNTVVVRFDNPLLVFDSEAEGGHR
jgi:hypothetical protein